MNPVLLLAALLPAIILLIRVYKLDKIEKEPRPLLVKLVIVGALTGVAASLIEAVLTRLLNRYYSGSELGYLLLENFVAVALVEELCKHWPVRRFAWKHPAFDYRFDAVVYWRGSPRWASPRWKTSSMSRSSVCPSRCRVRCSPCRGISSLRSTWASTSARPSAPSARAKGSCATAFCARAFSSPSCCTASGIFRSAVDSPWMTAAFYAFVLVFFLSANHRLRAASEDDQQL